MQWLALGGDVSKGYVDFRGLCPQGCALREWSQRYDDTPAGHAAVRQALLALLRQYPEARLRVGFECSGGLERNWLRLFRDALQDTPHEVYQLNALAVKRFRDRELHGSVTDPRSARTIANYLRSGLRVADRPYEPELEGLVVRYRMTCNTRDRATQVRNELQSLLPVVHPELVQYCRRGVPGWVLELLQQYPTASALGRARVATVARLPQVTSGRAELLVTAAQQSVGALQDADTGATVVLLAQEIQRLDVQVTAAKAYLGARLEHDPVVQRLVTIPGIGLWTAVVLRLEIGSFARFRKVASLIAFAGLDPVYHHSGDGELRHGISKRGRSEIRAALYMAVLTCLRYNLPVQAYYRRLVASGKKVAVALTACMSKLLRIAYACVRTDTDFAAQHEAQLAAQRALPVGTAAPPSVVIPAATAPPAETVAELATATVSAPVSWREAKKRRAASAPPAGKTRKTRGHAAAPLDDTPPVVAGQLYATPSG
jgi:transposase